MLPARVIVTLTIIAGIGIGTGAILFGILMVNEVNDDVAGITAAGAAVLAASLAGLVAHLFGGFQRLDDDH